MRKLSALALALVGCGAAAVVAFAAPGAETGPSSSESPTSFAHKRASLRNPSSRPAIRSTGTAWLGSRMGSGRTTTATAPSPCS